jgi:hypothetical protein
MPLASVLTELTTTETDFLIAMILAVLVHLIA